MEFWLLPTYYCNYSTPYLEKIGNLCYSQCPLRMFENNSTLTCDACPFDCLTCASNGNCLSCDQQTDHRYLVYSRCDPVPGYYESNAEAAWPCISGCAICSTQNTCLECFSGYNLVNHRCEKAALQEEVGSSGGVSVLLLFVGILVGVLVAYILLMIYLRCKRKP